MPEKLISHSVVEAQDGFSVTTTTSRTRRAESLGQLRDQIGRERLISFLKGGLEGGIGIAVLVGAVNILNDSQGDMLRLGVGIVGGVVGGTVMLYGGENLEMSIGELSDQQRIVEAHINSRNNPISG